MLSGDSFSVIANELSRLLISNGLPQENSSVSQILQNILQLVFEVNPIRNIVSD